MTGCVAWKSRGAMAASGSICSGVTLMVRLMPRTGSGTRACVSGARILRAREPLPSAPTSSVPVALVPSSNSAVTPVLAVVSPTRRLFHWKCTRKISHSLQPQRDDIQCVGNMPARAGPRASSVEVSRA